MENKVLRATQNTVIGFVMLIFIMGFFSQSIINYFLPKVQFAYALQAPVERTLEVEGVVEAAKSLKIRLGGNVIVEEYYAKVGDAVKVGDPIFRINTGYGIKTSRSDVVSLTAELEREKLRLDNLTNDNRKLDELSIAAMESRLQKSKESLVGQEALYKVGAIAMADLEDYKSRVADEALNLQKSKLQLDAKGKDQLIAIKEAEARIHELQVQISEGQKRQTFYSKIQEDGICYSDINGIILSINRTDTILPEDTIVSEIAEKDETKPLKFSASVHEEDYDLVKDAREIILKSGGQQTSNSIQITNISKLVGDNMVKVEGEVSGEINSDLKIGQKLKGKIQKKYEAMGLTVPKAAVLPIDEFRKGNKGTVYLLEEKEGILGKEYFAKEVEVKMLAIGDDAVIISGLEAYEKPMIILNLSYKISDGVKVFLWN